MAGPVMGSNAIAPAGSFADTRRLPAPAGDARRPRTRHGALVLAGFKSAAVVLAERAREIDASNVFPVPDGDTGSNMLATVRAALDEAKRVPAAERSLARVAEGLSFGALVGARGNSGVILSQILRGMAESVEGDRPFDGRDLARALRRGSDAAFAAVARPVEGTILTVIDEAASAAEEAADHGGDLRAVASRSLAAARAALAETPALLPTLREAGVLDAGAMGLLVLLEGAFRHMFPDDIGAARVLEKATPPLGRSAAETPSATDNGSRRLEEDRPLSSGDFGYEVVFLVTTRTRPLDPLAIRADLESIGESVLVAGDERTMKVHVHTARPDEVLAYGLSLGSLSRIAVENLDEQVDGVREAQRDASRPTSGPDVLALVEGEGFARVFESFGVRHVVHGDRRSASPPDLARAIRATAADDVVLLANGVVAASDADEAARLAKEKRVSIVPTRNSAEGLAALLALDSHADTADNTRRMMERASGVATFRITPAEDGGSLGDGPAEKGRVVALDADDRRVAAAEDAGEAIVAALSSLDAVPELVTVYLGEAVRDEEAAGVAEAIRLALGEVEVEIVEGGQRDSCYLVAAE